MRVMTVLLPWRRVLLGKSRAEQGSLQSPGAQQTKLTYREAGRGCPRVHHRRKLVADEGLQLIQALRPHHRHLHDAGRVVLRVESADRLVRAPPRGGWDVEQSLQVAGGEAGEGVPRRRGAAPELQPPPAVGVEVLAVPAAAGEGRVNFLSPSCVPRKLPCKEKPQLLRRQLLRLSSRVPSRCPLSLATTHSESTALASRDTPSAEMAGAMKNCAKRSIASGRCAALTAKW